MQCPALLHATQYHTGHFADLALRKLLNHLLHPLHAAIGITVVQHAQTFDEEEFRTMLTQRETTLRQLGITSDFLMAVCHEGLIGSRIQRVLDMHAEALVLSKIRVSQQRRPLTLRKIVLQHSQTAVSLCSPSLSRIHQEQVVPHVVIMFIVRIIVG